MLKPVDVFVQTIVVSLFIVLVCFWAYVFKSLLVRFFRFIEGHTVTGYQASVRRVVYALFHHRARA